MKKLSTNKSIIARIATSAFQASFDNYTIQGAQVKQSKVRNFVFARILNEPFIQVTEESPLKTLVEVYGLDLAKEVASLTIYKLANPDYRSPVATIAPVEA